jgi:hypothetical protein
LTLAFAPFQRVFLAALDASGAGGCCRFAFYESAVTNRKSPHLRALCFHGLTNCLSRNPFVLIIICVARGCGFASTDSSPCPANRKYSYLPLESTLAKVYQNKRLYPGLFT